MFVFGFKVDFHTVLFILPFRIHNERFTISVKIQTIPIYPVYYKSNVYSLDFGPFNLFERSLVY